MKTADTPLSGCTGTDLGLRRNSREHRAWNREDADMLEYARVSYTNQAELCPSVMDSSMLYPTEDSDEPVP